MKRGEEVEAKLGRIRAGGAARYHEKARAEGKLFCRERLALLLDAERRHAMGERGRRFVRDNRGAIDRLVALVEAHLPPLEACS